MGSCIHSRCQCWGFIKHHRSSLEMQQWHPAIKKKKKEKGHVYHIYLVIDSHTDTCGFQIFYMLNVGHHTGKHDLLLLRKLFPPDAPICSVAKEIKQLPWPWEPAGPHIRYSMCMKYDFIRNKHFTCDESLRPCNLKKTLFSVGLSSLPVRCWKKGCVAAHTGILHYTRIMIFHSKTYTKHIFTVSFTHCHCSVGVLTFLKCQENWSRISFCEASNPKFWNLKLTWNLLVTCKITAWMYATKQLPARLWQTLLCQAAVEGKITQTSTGLMKNHLKASLAWCSRLYSSQPWSCLFAVIIKCGDNEFDVVFKGFTKHCK